MAFIPSRIKNLSRSGFTLIELSIVLVVLGILVSAVIYARSVITTSRLQTVITDVDGYTAAVNNFKGMYQGLPGDISSATTNWGFPMGANSADIPPYSASCATIPITGTLTCNGNSDGQIGGVTSYEYETFRFWQHLYNAKMLPKPLSGIAGSGGVYDSVIGTNVPAGSMPASGFSVAWFGTIGNSSFCGTSDCFPGFYGNVIQFGGQNLGTITNAPVLTADQAQSIDTKIDDGLPASGKVRAYISTSTINPGCTTTASSATSAYNVANTNVLCSLIFVMGF